MIVEIPKHPPDISFVVAITLMILGIVYYTVMIDKQEKEDDIVG